VVSETDPHGRILGFLVREITTRNRKIMFLGNKARLVLRAVSLCLDNVGPITSPRPVTGIASLFTSGPSGSQNVPTHASLLHTVPTQTPIQWPPGV
jgi:hypothetical protein